MKTETFSVVFKKLDELVVEESQRNVTVEDNLAELDEIAELRKLVFEMTEEEPAYRTST